MHAILVGADAVCNAEVGKLHNLLETRVGVCNAAGDYNIYVVPRSLLLQTIHQGSKWLTDLHNSGRNHVHLIFIRDRVKRKWYQINILFRYGFCHITNLMGSVLSACLSLSG